MSETSSIDDVLASATAGIPPKVEIEPQDSLAEEVSSESTPEKAQETTNEYSEPEDPAPKDTQESSVDEYGNEKPAPRQYSQEEADEYVNRMVRERLARIERNAQPPTPQQVQQAQQAGFQYNAESGEDWQQQLAAFTEQVIVQREQRQMQQAHQMREDREKAEFHHKFQAGMGRFPDFVDAVGSQPITDYMTEALSGIKDPAAFIYAASKRMPQELERISKIQGKAAQMVEMGKLEERMKQVKPATKAPKPISRTQEDMAIKHSNEKREPTIEELIAQSDAKRRALQAQKRR
jgi:hypothetical protein